MNIDLAEFANFFDICCLIIIVTSALLSLKAGLLKNLLNLTKWIALIGSLTLLPILITKTRVFK